MLTGIKGDSDGDAVAEVVQAVAGDDRVDGGLVGDVMVVVAVSEMVCLMAVMVVAVRMVVVVELMDGMVVMVVAVEQVSVLAAVHQLAVALLHLVQGGQRLADVVGEVRRRLDGDLADVDVIAVA